MQTEIDFPSVAKFIFIRPRCSEIRLFSRSTGNFSPWNASTTACPIYTKYEFHEKRAYFPYTGPSRLQLRQVFKWAATASSEPTKKNRLFTQNRWSSFYCSVICQQDSILYPFVPSFIVALPRNVCLYLFRTIFFARLPFSTCVVPRSQKSARLSSAILRK